MNMYTDQAEGAGGALGTGTRRACDQCRLRKIRCDKESPCSNCKSAKRTCSSFGLGQKPKEDKHRVLISRQYEKKLDDMQDRLAGIENLLRNLSVQSSLSTTPAVGTAPVQIPSLIPHLSHGSQTTGDENARAGGSSTVLESEDADPYEGNSSLAAHAAFASEFLENAVQSNVVFFNGSTSRMDAALSSLRQMVHLQKNPKTINGDEEPFNGKKSPPRNNVRLKDLPMPPMTLVVEKLKHLKRSPGNVMLLTVTCFTDIDLFTERCRRIYFNTDDQDISISLFIIVNAGLAYLFWENALSEKSGSPERAQLQACYALCQNNVDLAISILPLIMPSSLEAIEALLLGAAFAIDLSKPSLAWLLTNRAAHMCRTMGLHQEASVRNDNLAVRDSKSLLFWSTYMLDKGLSIRLGRASVLQDYDISLPSVLQKTYNSTPLEVTFSLWIKHSEMQGKIYQRLYSPGALRQTDAARVEQVRLIVKELEFLLEETVKLHNAVRKENYRESKMYGLLLKSDEVSYFSSLALAYRAIPPTGSKSKAFADECLETARVAMRSHQEAMGMMDDTSLKILYLHWTILYAPFIPFIVIFCHAIETSDTEDLQRLELFVQSLQESCNISPAIDKLYKLSKLLYNVALLYVEAKSQQAMDSNMIPVGNEFNMYLNQLGFMPMDQSMNPASPDDAGAADDPARSLFQPNQLGDWFSGNNYILGLVEEDLSTFDTSAWSQ